MIKELKEIIGIYSVAEHGKDGFPYGPGPARVLEETLKICKAFGFRTKNADGKYGYAEIGEGSEIIGILVHLDVVPAGKGWDYPPFEATVVGNRVYGRGIIDDKGPTVAVIHAMKDILDSGMPIKKRIRIIFGQTEESGDWNDMEDYKACEELPTYGFTPDGDFPALYGEKGILLVSISMDKSKSGFISFEGGEASNAVPDYARAIYFDGNGEEKTAEAHGVSAHGSMPETGENAITKLIWRLCDNGVRNNFLDMYIAAVGDSFYGNAMGINMSDQESGRLTMNAGVVCEKDGKLILKLDIRYPVTKKMEDIMELIKKRLEVFPVEIKAEHHKLPIYMDKDGPIITKLLQAYEEVTGDKAEPIVIGGGTYARAMENIIAFGPNFPGHENREHQENEYMLMEDLRALRVIYSKALKNLLAD